MSNIYNTLSLIDGVLLTPQKIIEVPGGDVLHAAKASAPGITRFGEAYFSTVEHGFIKAWKRHHEMTLNIVVPVGAIHFVLFDDRQNSPTKNEFYAVTLSAQNYHRLTIPPMVWMGFQGASPQTNLLLNIADIEHRPEEADRMDVHEINFEWEQAL